MPLVTGNEPPVQIDLTTPGEWVMVRPRLSRADTVRIRQALVRNGAIAGGTAELDPATVLEANAFAALEVAIVAWSFDVPVTPDAIRQLSEEDAELIDLRLGELYARPEAEKNG